MQSGCRRIRNRRRSDQRRIARHARGADRRRITAPTRALALGTDARGARGETIRGQPVLPGLPRRGQETLPPDPVAARMAHRMRAPPGRASRSLPRVRECAEPPQARCGRGTHRPVRNVRVRPARCGGTTLRRGRARAPALGGPDGGQGVRRMPRHGGERRNVARERGVPRAAGAPHSARTNPRTRTPARNGRVRCAAQHRTRGGDIHRTARSRRAHRSARRGRTPDATRSRRTPASGGRGRPHPAGMVRARGYRAGAARKGGARAARERSSRVEKHAADAVERTAAAARGEADDEAARALGRDRMGLSPRDGPGKWSRRTATTGARGARATSACTAGSERGWRERCTSGIMECGTGDRPSMNFRSRSGFAADAPPHSKAVEP